MIILSRILRHFFVFVVCWFSLPAASAQSLPPELYQGMRWRMIGPFRGGRTIAITGISGKPNVFYMAPNNGGVWKTNDYGHTWSPIFDDQPTGSIGTLAVAPSNPDIIYVGSGEGLRRPDLSVGDGIYKSSDGGKSWKHLGLRDTQQIAAILVDPKDPNRVFVAAVGHPYGPNAERGIFRSLDGGRTGRKSYPRMMTSAALTSHLIRETHRPFMACYGLLAGRPGRPGTPTARPAAAFISRKMAGRLA